VRAHDSDSHRVFISTPYTVTRSITRDLSRRERFPLSTLNSQLSTLNFEL
jgi:hypothetical protein